MAVNTSILLQIITRNPPRSDPWVPFSTSVSLRRCPLLKIHSIEVRTIEMSLKGTDFSPTHGNKITGAWLEKNAAVFLESGFFYS